MLWTRSLHSFTAADRSIGLERSVRRRFGGRVVLGTIVFSTLLFTLPRAFAAQAPVDLGSAESFAVLAGAGITNTGPTTIVGDVGTFPTADMTGFGSVTLIGANHGGDAVTQGAKDDLVVAYDDAFGRGPGTNVPVELGGSTLPAGVYKSGTFGLTGTLTLDAEGDANAEFIFQAGSTLISELNSRVVLLRGADPCRVVWQVGSSATFKKGTQFVGDVLAYTSITAQTGAAFEGRLLARNGAVTLDTNTITRADCETAPSATPTSTETATPATPSSSPSAVVTIPETTESGVPATPVAQMFMPPAGPPMAGPSGGTPSAPWSPPFLAVTGLTVLGLLGAGLALLSVGGGTLVLFRRRSVAQPK